MDKAGRMRQTVKMLKWIRKYPGWWYMICTPDDANMSPDLMSMLIKRLTDKGLYELIFVLLMVHRKQPFMQNMPQDMWLESLITHWQDDGETIISKLVNTLE